jgi:hypothetical protein
MMKPGRIGIVLDRVARRAKNITKMAVVILDMRIAIQAEFVLAEAKYIEQDPIIEFL